MRRVVVAIVVVALGLVGTVSASADEAAGATAVRELWTELAMAAEAGDAPAARWAIGELRPLLSELATGERYAVTDDGRSLAATADAEAVTALSQVDQQFPAQKADLPPAPAFLNLLLQKLLAVLSQLFDQLLGTVALPV